MEPKMTIQNPGCGTLSEKLRDSETCLHARLSHNTPETAPAYSDQTDKEDLENHNTHVVFVYELCREEKKECPAPAHMESELV